MEKFRRAELCRRGRRPSFALLALAVIGCGGGDEPFSGFGDLGANTTGNTDAGFDAMGANPAPTQGTTGVTSPVTTADGAVGTGSGAIDGGSNESGDGGAIAEVTEDAGATTGNPTAAAHCLDGITDYKEKGAFNFKAATHGSVKAWVPELPANCKVPVVHLANGTGARCSSYGPILEHLASHGFLATCYEDTNTGQGEQCITAIETMYDQYPDIADDKIGSTGHSQGGGASLMCAYRAEQAWGDSRSYAVVAMEPAHGYGDAPANYATYYAQITSPVLMFNGSADFLVSARWVQQGFDALPSSTEAYYYTAEGASHVPVPTRWTQEVAVAFFRWKLLGDAEACRYFKDMPNGTDWSQRDERNPEGC